MQLLLNNNISILIACPMDLLPHIWAAVSAGHSQSIFPDGTIFLPHLLDHRWAAEQKQQRTTHGSEGRHDSSAWGQLLAFLTHQVSSLINWNLDRNHAAGKTT